MVRAGDRVEPLEGNCIVVLASLQKNYIRLCKNLSQYALILYPLIQETYGFDCRKDGVILFFIQQTIPCHLMKRTWLQGVLFWIHLLASCCANFGWNYSCFRVSAKKTFLPQKTNKVKFLWGLWILEIIWMCVFVIFNC